MCNTQQHNTSSDRWHTEHGKCWSLAFCPSGKGSSSHGGTDLNGAKGNVEKDCIERAKAERVHDQGTESCDATARNSSLVSMLHAMQNNLEGSTHEMEKINANQHQVLKSSRLSITCSHFHSVETTPIWLALRRSTARTLSWSLRNLASTGESAMKRLQKSVSAWVLQERWDLQDDNGEDDSEQAASQEDNLLSVRLRAELFHWCLT